MSQNDPSKTPTTIKIAPKEASQRNSSVDPGPGDPNAAPSVAPELVDVPPPPTASQLVVKSTNSYKSTTGSAVGSTKLEPSSPSPSATDGSGAVHDEDEEGEGEVEHPDEGSSPSTAPTSPAGLRGTSTISQGGASKSVSKMGAKSASNMDSGAPSSVVGSSKMSGKPSTMIPSDFQSSSTSKGGAGNKKKVTKFRYHKRITVRTSGKTSPSTIMAKVNRKDHKAGITPSTIDDMDPQELMRRAGIKGNKKTHWRVRLRQTKRLTKNGKTTTQTKVAYRDSEGNKRVKTSLSPYCKTCGKKLEDCKCDSKSQSQM